MPVPSRLLTGLFAAVLLLGATQATAGNHTVNVGGAAGFAYVPATLTITAGDTVTFVNAGGFHNAVSNPGSVTSFRCAAGCDGAGGSGNPSAAAWSAVVTFPSAGTIGYFCEVHGAPGVGMTGTIIVNVPVGLQKFEIE